jgi:hypothetical protein
VREHLAGLFAFYPHRCHACQARFLRFRYASEPYGEGGPTSTEREIRSTRTQIRWKRKKQELLLYALGLLVFLLALYFITRPYTPR